MKRYSLVAYNYTPTGTFTDIEVLVHHSTRAYVNYLFYKIYNYSKSCGKDLTKAYFIEVHEYHLVEEL